MTIYDWPISLFRNIEWAARNFIWSGDVIKTKIVIMAWKSICKAIYQGGLGIRSLLALNVATNLKPTWDFLNLEEHWTILVRSWIMRKNKLIKHHILSSIWSNIKVEIPIISDNSSWIIGNGNSISFWFDSWYGDPLHLEVFNSWRVISQFLYFYRSWNFSSDLGNIPNSIQVRDLNYHIPFDLRSDKRIWNFMKIKKNTRMGVGLSF